MKIIIIEDEGITRQWLKKKLEELSVDYHVEGVFQTEGRPWTFLSPQRMWMWFLRIYACRLWTEWNFWKSSRKQA